MEEMKPILVVEASGLEPGEATKILKMLESAIFNSKRDPAPPARIRWQMRELTPEEKGKLERP